MSGIRRVAHRVGLAVPVAVCGLLALSTCFAQQAAPDAGASKPAPRTLSVDVTPVAPGSGPVGVTGNGNHTGNGNVSGNGNAAAGTNGNGNGDGQALVTNIFADEDIRQALRDIGAQAGAIIVPDQSVQGSVSVELRDVPFERALEMILFAGGYVHKEIDGVYYVGSGNVQATGFAHLSDVKRVELRNVQAVELIQVIQQPFRDYVQADEANNVVIVTAPQALMEKVLAQIEAIDQACPQVMIEVMVVEINKEAARDHGMRWRWDSFGFDVGDPLFSTGGVTGNLSDRSSMSWTEATTEDLANIKLLVDQRDAEVRANPRISTLNGREAELFVGREQYFSVLTGNAVYPTTQLQLVKAGITLKIKPFVGENGLLTINIDPEVSDVVNLSSNGAPIVATRRVHTIVRCTEGSTVVLGGLTQVIKQIIETKVPILGDIPILGNLFKQSSKSNVETEVVVFLRPHILNDWAPADWEPADGWPQVNTLSDREAARAEAAAATAAAARAADDAARAERARARREAAEAEAAAQAAAATGGDEATEATRVAPAASDTSEAGGVPPAGDGLKKSFGW